MINAATARMPTVPPLDRLDDYLPPAGSQHFRLLRQIYDGKADGVYLVVSGFVQIYTHIDGGRFVGFGIYGPGSFFGESSITGHRTVESARSITGNVNVVKWTPSQVNEATARSASAAQSLSRIIIGRARDYQIRLDEMGYKITTRLVMRLLALNKEFGRDGEEFEPPRIIPAFTHEVIASEVMTAREVVTANFKSFKNAGAMIYSRKSIGIWPNKLRAVGHE